MMHITKRLAGLLLTALAGAFLAATLVRFAPGADSDERDFDPRLSAASIQAFTIREPRTVTLFATTRRIFVDWCAATSELRIR
jgi:hypothetical protein